MVANVGLHFSVKVVRSLVVYHLVLAADSLVSRERPRSISFLHMKQIPAQTPMYISYGPPQFSTFDNATSACKACIEFFPAKEDGKRFHSRMYHAPNGGIWEHSCRAGLCDFMDPQTDPVGGIVGHGVGPGGKPDGRTCATLDPVQWYSNCEDVIFAATYSPLDVTRYCTYREQIFIPPPLNTASYFAGNPKAWARVGGSNEQCLMTIEKQGSALFDSMTFCDTDMEALSGCCESVFGALNCLGETASARGIGDQTSIFASMSVEAMQMVTVFQKYCVPLCEGNKEEFCTKYPGADVCVKHETCESCTVQGGLWCPKLKSCHCPGPKPPCIAEPITVPLKCNVLSESKFSVRGSGNKGGGHVTSKDDAGGDGAGDGAGAGGACKYAEFARNWKRG